MRQLINVVRKIVIFIPSEILKINKTRQNVKKQYENIVCGVLLTSAKRLDCAPLLPARCGVIEKDKLLIERMR